MGWKTALKLLSEIVICVIGEVTAKQIGSTLSTVLQSLTFWRPQTVNITQDVNLIPIFF